MEKQKSFFGMSIQVLGNALMTVIALRIASLIVDKTLQIAANAEIDTKLKGAANAVASRVMARSK